MRLDKSRGCSQECMKCMKHIDETALRTDNCTLQRFGNVSSNLMFVYGEDKKDDAAIGKKTRTTILSQL